MLNMINIVMFYWLEFLWHRFCTRTWWKAYAYCCCFYLSHYFGHYLSHYYCEKVGQNRNCAINCWPKSNRQTNNKIMEIIRRKTRITNRNKHNNKQQPPTSQTTNNKLTKKHSKNAKNLAKIMSDL